MIGLLAGDLLGREVGELALQDLPALAPQRDARRGARDAEVAELQAAVFVEEMFDGLTSRCTMPPARLRSCRGVRSRARGALRAA